MTLLTFRGQRHFFYSLSLIISEVHKGHHSLSFILFFLYQAIEILADSLQFCFNAL